MTDPKDTTTQDDNNQVVKTPTLSAEQISRLNTLVGDVEDDQAEGQGDLSEEDIEDIKAILDLD